MASDRVKLFTLLGDHPATMALKNGAVASSLIDLEFDDVKVPNTAFKALVREAKYDLAELAIVTFLQAKALGKPYTLLPITVMGRGQLHTLFYNSARGHLAPADLACKRIGVRSYTTTTGAWVRGILNEHYGVDPNRVNWITFEDPHIAEFRDPPQVTRAAEGKTLEAMLLDGEIDAAILAKTDQPAPLAPVFPDAAAVDAQWAQTHGGIPINHMLVIRSAIARERPDVVREIYRMFLAAKQAAYPTPPSPDPVRFGFEACRGSLEAIIDYSVQQKLISRRFSVEELFSETRGALHAEIEKRS
jgi:4,5-dihydroxyphthalate decarboxylase